MPLHLKRTLAWTAALLAISGCYYQRPVSVTRTEFSPGVAQKLTASVLERSREIKTLKALTRVVVEAGGEKDAFRYAVVARTPDDLRLEILPLNGAYAFGLFVASGGKAVFIDATSQTRETSLKPEDLMQEVTGFSMSVHDVMPLVTCRVPERFIFEGMLYSGPKADEAFIVAEGGRYIFEIDSKSGLFTLMQKVDVRKGAVEMELKCGEIREAGSIKVPAGFSVSLPSSNAKAGFLFSNISPNAVVSSDLFSQVNDK